MNLDELSDEIGKVSSREEVQGLASLLAAWKGGQDTAEGLRDTVERYLGNTWIEQDEDHEKVYQLWSSFRDQAISGIAGMTMNERLYWFGLFARFEAAENDEEKLRIYKKLHAKP